MNAGSPHVHLDLELVDLVTGETGVERRRDLLHQIRQCQVCRARADVLLAAASDLLAAAPAVTPPLGFETRVASRHAQTASAHATGTRSPRPHRWWTAAAAVVLAVAVGVVAAAALADDEPTSLDTEVLALRHTGTDEAVGTVTFSESASGPVMIVALIDAPPNVAYRCRMRLADGTVAESRAWPPASRGAWILDVPGAIDDIETVEIVADDTGRVWSSATL